MWLRLQQIDISKILGRFPVSAFLSVLATICAIRLIAYDGDTGTELSSTISLLIVTYFLFLGGIVSRLLRESRQSIMGERIAWAVFVVLGVLFYFWLPDNYDLLNTQLFRLPFYIVGIAAIFHLIIAYLPFVSRGSDGDFWEYNRRLFIRFVESAFFSGVLFLALLLAMLALDKLFGVDFPDRTVGYIAVTMLGVFHSWYFLSKFPDLEYDDVVERPLSAFLVFTQFILIPITMIYMVILYAYGIKILIDGELPRGWIGNLSLWFSVIGILTYLLNYLNPRFAKHKFVSLFRQSFFLVLLVPALLMIISLYRRIGDYGVTEERYVLAMVASWIISMIMIYGLLRWKSLKWLPISLSLVIGIGLFAGPLSIFGCTLRSQEGRLHHMMIEAGLLSEGGDKTSEVHNTIYNQLRFIDQRSDMQFLNDWLTEPIALHDENLNQDQSNLELIAAHLDLTVNAQTSGGNQYFNHYIEPNWSMSILEYDSMHSFSLKSYESKETANEVIYLSDGNLFLSHSDTTYQVILSDSLRQWNLNGTQKENLLHTALEFDDLQGDLYINAINGIIVSSEEYLIEDMSGILFIKGE